MGSPHPAQGDSRIAPTMRFVVGTPVGTPRPVGLPMAGDKPRRYGVAFPKPPYSGPVSRYGACFGPHHWLGGQLPEFPSGSSWWNRD